MYHNCRVTHGIRHHGLLSYVPSGECQGERCDKRRNRRGITDREKDTVLIVFFFGRDRIDLSRIGIDRFFLVPYIFCQTVGGRGTYQEWGKDAVEMTQGSVINIPAGRTFLPFFYHWHDLSVMRLTVLSEMSRD